MQTFYRGISRFGRDCDKKASRRLGIEEQGSIFFGNACAECDAIAEKIQIVIQAAGDHALACCVEGSGKRWNGFVLNLNRNRGNSLLWIAERHFAGMTKYAKSGDIRDCVNCVGICFCRDFM